MKEEDYNIKEIKKLIKKRYKPNNFKRFGDFVENVFIFLTICLFIIFRPINLIIGGIILIILLLI